MKRITLYLPAYLFITINAFAGMNPVEWSLSPTTGFRLVNMNESTSVVYTLTVNRKFPGPVVLHTQFNKNGGDFTIADSCNNHTFNPGEYCHVTITFTPTTSSTSSIQMKYQYNNNVIPLPTLTAKGANIPGDVVGTFDNLPQSFTLSNPEQKPIFTITYTNQGQTVVTGYAGNALGSNLLSTNPTNVATVSVVTANNFCGNNNAPVTIKPGESCTIQGQLTPISVGQVSVSGLFTYSNGTKTANPNKMSSVVNGGGHCQLFGEATLPFQNPTYQYADNVLQFTFTNHCSSSVTLGNVNYNPTGTSTSPMITPTTGGLGVLYDNCSGVTLSANNSCTTLVSVIPQAAGSLSVTASVTADTLPTTAVSSTTVQTPEYAHNITFVNQCPFPVWYGVSQPSGSSDPTPSPSPAAYLLPQNAPGVAPASKSIKIQGSYNGQFFPRTGCSIQGSNFVCATGDCGSGVDAQCPSGAVYEPYTRIEETFTASSQGGYDIALINGASIPSEIKGLGPQSSQTSSPAAPLICAGAGAPIQAAYSTFTPQYGPPPPPAGPSSAPATPLGNCPWEYSAPNVPANSSSLYNFVSKETTVTASCSECTSGVCGIAFKDSPSSGNIVPACGNLLGYWTINQLCSTNTHYSGPAALNPNTVFNCNTPITSIPGTQAGYPSGTTAYSLYACVPNGAALIDCFNAAGNNTYCCGAENWNQAPYLTWASQQAYNTNPDWGSSSTLIPTPLQSIEWLKNACPTAYAYPDDDPSSTFNCNSSQANQSNNVNMDFEVVFCPGGIIGALTPTP